MKHATRVALVFTSCICFASAALGQTTSTIAQQPAPSAAPRVTCSATFGPVAGMVASGTNLSLLGRARVLQCSTSLGRYTRLTQTDQRENLS